MHCSNHSFVLDLLNATACWETVAEVEHDGVELNYTENETQNVWFVDQGEPQGQEHAGEEGDGPDQVLFLKYLIHVDLWTIPESKSWQPC